MYIQSSLLLTITKFSMVHVSQILPVHFPNDTHLSCFQLPLIRNSAMACKIQSPRQRSLCEFISGVFPPSDGYAESQHNQHNLNSLFFRMAYEFTLLSTHQFFFFISHIHMDIHISNCCHSDGYTYSGLSLIFKFSLLCLLVSLSIFHIFLGLFSSNSSPTFLVVSNQCLC